MHYKELTALNKYLRAYWNVKNNYYDELHDEEWYTLAEDPDAGTRLAAAIFYYSDYERRVEAAKKPIFATDIYTLRHKVEDWLQLDLSKRWDRYPLEQKQRLTDDENQEAEDFLTEKAHKVAWDATPEQIHAYVIGEDEVLKQQIAEVSIKAIISKAVEENARKLKKRMAKKRWLRPRH